MTKTISYKPVGTVWMVTYDNRILGDDRAYSTHDEAREAALKLVNERPFINGQREYIFKPY